MTRPWIISRITLSVMTLGLSSYPTSADEEPPELAWEVVYPGDDGDFRHVIQTSDGRYAVAGFYDNGPSDIFCLILFSSSGQMQWVWNGESAGQSSVNWVEQDADGTLVTTGTFNSGGTRAMMLARVHLGGVAVWQKIYGELGRAWGMCLALLQDGSIAVGGRLCTENDYVPMITRTTSSGTRIWTKTYDGCSGTVTRLFERDSQIIAFIDRLNGSPMVVSYNYSGQLQWAWDYSGIMPSDEGDLCGCIDGYDYAMVAGGELARLDSNGSVLWQCLPPGGRDSRTLYSVSPAFDGGFVMCGATDMLYAGGQDYHFYDGWLARTDYLGGTEWWLADSSTYGHTVYRCVRQLEQGGYAVVGFTTVEGGIQRGLLRVLQPELGIPEDGAGLLPMLVLSPNPFSSNLGISWTAANPGPFQLAVFDIHGRLVDQARIAGTGTGSSGDYEWAPPASLPSGCYMVSIRDSSGTVCSGRATMLGNR